VRGLCVGILQRHTNVVAAHRCCRKFRDRSLVTGFVENPAVLALGGIRLGIAMGSLWLIYALVEALTTGKLRRGICSKCGAKLIHRGGGFYDGIVPNPWELLIYVLAVALAFGVEAATGGQSQTLQ
jgi:hypothetical protein